MRPSEVAMRLTREGNLVVAALAAAVFVGGCTQPHMIGGKIDPSDVTTPGVRYHLGRDVVVVNATVTRRMRVVTNTKTKEVLSSEELSRSVKGTVSLTTVPDGATTYYIWMRPGGTMDNSIGITLDARGTPLAVNTGSVDRSAEAIGNLIEFVARVAGTAIGAKGTRVSASPADAEAEVHEEVRVLQYSIPIEDVPASLDDIVFGGDAIEEMFRESGVLVTAEALDPTVTSSPVAGSAGEGGLAIFYRPTVPYLITLWSNGPQWERRTTEVLTRALKSSMRVARAPDALPELSIQSQAVFNVLHPATPAYPLTGAETAFSTQALAVGFDQAGRLLSVSRSGTSPVAGFAAGLNGASTGAATGLEEGLKLRQTMLQQQKEILELEKAIGALKAGKTGS
jgi:hypothetical protein